MNITIEASVEGSTPQIVELDLEILAQVGGGADGVNML
jgi:hypothetical protein